MALVLDGSAGISGVDGTASNPAIEGTDSNTGIFYPAADTVAIGTGGTERLRVDSSGNVGIATTSPDGGLDVEKQNSYFGDTTNGGRLYFRRGVDGSAVGRVGWISGSNVNFEIANDSGSGNILFQTNSAERMRLDASGNVGIGTSSPRGKLHVGSDLSSGATDASTGINLKQTSTTAATGFYIERDGERRGYYMYIGGALDSLTFQCNALGTKTDVMSLTRDGNVGIGTTTPGALFHSNGTIRYTNRPAAGTITAIGYDANGDLKNSSSSLRYKYDVEDYNKGLSTVMQLRPVSFKFNGEERTNIGFIAEEVDALGLPEVMLYNEEEQPDGVLYANMVSLLTKAIQELNAKVEAQAAEIAALKGNA